LDDWLSNAQNPDRPLEERVASLEHLLTVINLKVFSDYLWPTVLATQAELVIAVEQAGSVRACGMVFRVERGELTRSLPL
jgi:hypothetical protein